ncbi:hypothetical protein V8E51_007452 [Hyaloscypha variabilis]
MRYVTIILARLGSFPLSTSSLLNATNRRSVAWAEDSCTCHMPGQWCGSRWTWLASVAGMLSTPVSMDSCTQRHKMRVKHLRVNVPKELMERRIIVDWEVPRKTQEPSRLYLTTPHHLILQATSLPQIAKAKNLHLLLQNIHLNNSPSFIQPLGITTIQRPTLKTPISSKVAYPNILLKMHYLTLILAILGLATLSTSSPFNLTDRGRGASSPCICKAVGQWCGVRAKQQPGRQLSGNPFGCWADVLWTCGEGSIGQQALGTNCGCRLGKDSDSCMGSTD